MTTKQLLLLISSIALVSYFIWEYYVWLWASGEDGAIIRIDLLFIWPALLVLFVVTGISWFKADE